MKEKLKKLILSIAIRAYDKLLVRFAPDTFLDRETIRTQAKAAKLNDWAIDIKKYVFDKYPMRVEATVIEYENAALGISFEKYETNLPFLTKKPRNCIGPQTKLKVKYLNSLYRLMVSACSDSNSRVENNGYNLNETATLQETLCALYRNNEYDDGKVLFKYLHDDINDTFVCNDCFNCHYMVKPNCRLYLSGLNNNSER